MKMEVGFSVSDSTFLVALDGERQDYDVEYEGMITVGGGSDPYTGEYEVKPKITPQVLRTKDKYMVDDLTVLEIPYAEVSNTSGGLTATIG